MRGRGSGFRFAYRLKPIARIVEPKHRCANIAPARARREIVEDLPHGRRQPTKTSQREVVITRPKRAPERSRFGTDIERRITFGSPIVSPELFLQERAI